MNPQEPGNQAAGNPELDESTAGSPRHRALVAQSAGQPAMAMLAGAPPQNDVIRGGMDGASLFHSFRRRWPLALGMSLLMGIAASGALYYLFPESSSAVAMFHVDSKPPTVLDPVGNEANFDTYRRTQIQWLTSSFVLNEAMRPQEIANSPVFDGVDPERRVDWLAEELKVSFPQESELLTIELAGSAQPAELEKVLEAVAKAYYDEVVFAEHTTRLKPRDILRGTARKLNDEIIRKTKAYYDLATEGNSSRAMSGVDPDTTMMLSQVRDLQKKLVNGRAMLMEKAMAFEVLKKQLNDPNLMDYRIEQMIAADPSIAALKEQQMAYQMYYDQMRATYKSENRSTKAAQAQVESVNRQIAEAEQRLRAEINAQLTDDPDPMLIQEQQALQVMQQIVQRENATTQAELDSILEKLREKGRVNTDLEMRYAEIEQLRAVQRRIGERIEQWDVEAEAPMRVQRIPGIEKNPNINATQRYAIAGLGGLGAFALTCFGISYMEFRNRRLNGAEQVDEGLGIRVIGTLPSLSGRTKLDPNHPVVAQLTESIDSVRTALMHESASSRHQLVLVTSAAAMEGRTTVASQLAASLARAGRRTLLIDGDLRRPALHTLFDVPLEDGLCEVLRAETDVADVVRPTHAEGLWLMTAGYCDADAVHALATDQAQPIFEKLRADYDFIIIDGAPVLGLSDSLLFGQHCDGAIMSVLRDHTNVPKIHQSSELLRSVGIRLIGAVVNGVPFKADRRVTHLQIAGSKSARKQLENAEA